MKVASCQGWVGGVASGVSDAGSGDRARDLGAVSRGGSWGLQEELLAALG